MKAQKEVVQPSLGDTITSLSTGNTYTIGQRIGEGGFGIVYGLLRRLEQ